MKKSINIFKLRDSNINDEKLTLDWANDKAVRENSFTTKIINKEEHQKWFKNILMNPNFTQYIMTDLKDRPIGQVRFEVRDKFAFIDVSIDINFRGKGFSSVLLGKSFKKFFFENKTKYLLIAEVKKINLPSISLFSAFKYKLKKYYPNKEIYQFTFDFHNKEFIKFINKKEFEL